MNQKKGTTGTTEIGELHCAAGTRSTIDRSRGLQHISVNGFQQALCPPLGVRDDLFLGRHTTMFREVNARGVLVCAAFVSFARHYVCLTYPCPFIAAEIPFERGCPLL